MGGHMSVCSMYGANSSRSLRGILILEPARVGFWIGSTVSVRAERVEMVDFILEGVDIGECCLAAWLSYFT